MVTAAFVRQVSLVDLWDSVPDSTIDEAVRQAQAQYAALKPLPTYPEIVALAALHMLYGMGLGQGEGGGGGLGPVSSASADKVSVSFAVGAVTLSAGADMSTPYGRRLLALLPRTTFRAGGLGWG